MNEDVDFERRFGGVSRLYGNAGLAKLQGAHVVVIGIGGVGSWAAEALARNAVGIITLVDLDNIAESNVNRQIHALDGEFGKAKVTAMAERIRAINSTCVVREIEDFVTLDNASKMLDFHSSVMIDCTDDVTAKIALVLNCKATQTPLIMLGGAGGRLDATKIKTADLAFVEGDKLLAKVRNLLRRDYQFPKASNSKKSAKFEILTVYSDEQVTKPNKADSKKDALEANIHAAAGDACFDESDSITGLNCAGYGSSVCVTAPFGFIAAGLAIQQLLKAK
jgi:tRNA threonylcarbamoyladenosine dehydratase